MWFQAICLVAGLIGSSVPANAEEKDSQDSSVRVVEFHLSGIDVEDPAPPNPFEIGETSFRGALAKLRDIARDPEISGLRLYLDGALDFARSLDVLRELRQIKSANKQIVCYSETLDQNSAMYASLADHLVVPPSANIVLEGITIELMYIKELLSKLGVKFEVLHIGDFKTAYEDFARDSMSESQRETLQAVVDEYFDQLVRVIAEQRDLSEESVLAFFEEVFVTPEAALEHGLVDQVGYEDEFEQQVEELFGEDVEWVSNYGEEDARDLENMMANPMAMFTILQDMFGGKKKEYPEGPKIAIVYATGTIMSGKSTAGFGGQTMGSETIVAALDEARENEDVKAVILRVNSPGGSALASDMIWHAIERCQEKKPVIASMGRVAASGGYWISMGCDRIIAQPSTITGSIGVVSAVPDVTETLDMAGVNVEVVGAGPRYRELALLDGVSPFLKARITAAMEDVYKDFIAKVADGRGLNPAQVSQFAQGRVWTGRQAKDLGLVDALGGLEDALTVACYLGGQLHPGSTPVIELPEPPDFLTQLEESFGQFVEARAPLERTLALLGFADLLPVLELFSESRAGLHRDLVQAVLPFHVRVR